MFQEMAFEYPVQLTVNDFLAPNLIKPTTFPNCIQSVAEHHLAAVQLDGNSMAARNLAWVLVGMTIEVRAATVSQGMTLIGKTWHAQTRGPYFRREFTFSDQAGVPIFCGVTFSVVMDLTTRHILKKFILPVDTGDGNGIFVLDDVRPIFRSKADYTFHSARSVHNSYIDLLGHVNNTRYCEFAFDALPQQDMYRPVRRIRINFTGELRLGDTVSIHAGEQDGVQYFRGFRDADEKKSFDVAFTFADAE